MSEGFIGNNNLSEIQSVVHQLTKRLRLKLKKREKKNPKNRNQSLRKRLCDKELLHSCSSLQKLVFFFHVLCECFQEVSGDIAPNGEDGCMEIIHCLELTSRGGINPKYRYSNINLSNGIDRYLCDEINI